MKTIYIISETHSDTPVIADCSSRRKADMEFERYVKDKLPTGDRKVDDKIVRRVQVKQEKRGYRYICIEKWEGLF